MGSGIELIRDTKRTYGSTGHPSRYLPEYSSKVASTKACLQGLQRARGVPPLSRTVFVCQGGRRAGQPVEELHQKSNRAFCTDSVIQSWVQCAVQCIAGAVMESRALS